MEPGARWADGAAGATGTGGVPRAEGNGGPVGPVRSAGGVTTGLCGDGARSRGLGDVTRPRTLRAHFSTAAADTSCPTSRRAVAICSYEYPSARQCAISSTWTHSVERQRRAGRPRLAMAAESASGACLHSVFIPSSPSPGPIIQMPVGPIPDAFRTRVSQFRVRSISVWHPFHIRRPSEERVVVLRPVWPRDTTR